MDFGWHPSLSHTLVKWYFQRAFEKWNEKYKGKSFSSEKKLLGVIKRKKSLSLDVCLHVWYLPWSSHGIFSKLTNYDMLPFIHFLRCFINLTFLLHRALRIKWDILLDIWKCCIDFWCVWACVCVCVCVYTLRSVCLLVLVAKNVTWFLTYLNKPSYVGVLKL